MEEFTNEKAQKMLKEWHESFIQNLHHTSKASFTATANILNFIFIGIIIIFIGIIILAIIYFVLKYTTALRLWGAYHGLGNTEIFLFLGSYLAGIATLIGVMLQLSYIRKSEARKKHIENVEREYDILTSLISEIDPYCALKIYKKMNSMISMDREIMFKHYSLVDEEINIAIAFINMQVSKINLRTQIYDIKTEINQQLTIVDKIKSEFTKFFGNCSELNNTLYAIQQFLYLQQLTLLSKEPLAQSRLEEAKQNMLTTLYDYGCNSKIENIPEAMKNYVNYKTELITRLFLPTILILLKNYKEARKNVFTLL